MCANNQFKLSKTEYGEGRSSLGKTKRIERQKNEASPEVVLQNLGIQFDQRPLPLEKIFIHELNPRKRREELTLDDPLARSIATVGVLQSVLVHRENGGYGALDGGSRVIAAKMALDADPEAPVRLIPCLITEGLSRRQLIEIAFALNTTSRAMNVLDEVKMIEIALREIVGCEPDKASVRDMERIVPYVGMSVPTIWGRLKIRQLSPVIKDAIGAGEISTGLAVFLASRFDEGDYREAWKRWQDFAADFKRRYGKRPSATASQEFFAGLETAGRVEAAEVARLSSRAPQLDWYMGNKVPAKKGTARPDFSRVEKSRPTDASSQETLFRRLSATFDKLLEVLKLARTLTKQDAQALSPDTLANLISYGRFGGVSIFDVLSDAAKAMGELETFLEHMEKLGHDFGPVKG